MRCRYKEITFNEDQGGLRNLNLELMNKALMAKWLWKLKTKSGLWENIVLNKYVQIEGLPGLNQKWGIPTFCPT